MQGGAATCLGSAGPYPASLQSGLEGPEQGRWGAQDPTSSLLGACIFGEELAEGSRGRGQGCRDTAAQG